MKKGKILSAVSASVGLLGVVILVASFGEIEPQIEPNYLATIIGVALIFFAFCIAKRQDVMNYMKEHYSNEA